MNSVELARGVMPWPIGTEPEDIKTLCPDGCMTDEKGSLMEDPLWAYCGSINIRLSE
jgi:hypothetical protein